MNGQLLGIFHNERNYSVVYGQSCTTQLQKVLAANGAGKPLVVTPRSLGRLPLPDQFGMHDPVVFTGNLEHSPIPFIEEGLAAYRAGGCDSLVSYGGSSAVDVAKGIAMLVGHGSLDDLAGRAVRSANGMEIGHAEAEEKLPPIVAVPTTLSGAEFTYQAGLTNRDGVKHQYYHRGALPKTIFLDGALAAATPARLWASTGVKAIDHNVERLYSRNHQPLSDALALESTRILVSELGRSLEEGADPEIRQRLLHAAWMAQFSTKNVNVGVGHAVDHQIAALYDIPHGIIACVILPHAIRFNAVVAADQLARMASFLGVCGAEGVIDAIESLVRRLDLPSRLRELGVDRAQFEVIAERSLSDTAITGNPRTVESAAEIRTEILERAW